MTNSILKHEIIISASNPTFGFTLVRLNSEIFFSNQPNPRWTVASSATSQAPCNRTLPPSATSQKVKSVNSYNIHKAKDNISLHRCFYAWPAQPLNSPYFTGFLKNVNNPSQHSSHRLHVRNVIPLSYSIS